MSEATESFEKVTCPVCEGAGWDWKLCADEDLLVDDPVDQYWCSACQGSGKVDPS